MGSEADVLTGLTNTGLAGMLFVMWWFQHKKETALQEIIKEQMEDKRQMREDRAELIRIIKDNAALNAQLLTQLKLLSPA